PIVYSPMFGIQQDPMHLHTLGPKGHVPEEFIDLGTLSAGQRSIIRTGVISLEPKAAVLAVGANARNAARVNEQSAQDDSSAYLWMTPVQLRSGENPIELTITAEGDDNVRLFWCL